MPRPRFEKLPPVQRRAVLRAALDEFAAHGFRAASLNRIIDAAGLSKGAMYYYFDGKEDLYQHVARTELGRLFASVGPFPVPSAPDPEGYWSALEDHYRRLMNAFMSSPKLAALARDWIVASASPMLRLAQAEMEAALAPWFAEALTAGRRVGAVRDDVPATLLIAMVFAMGQAMDIWLLTQAPVPAAEPDLARVYIGMIRRVLEP